MPVVQLFFMNKGTIEHTVVITPDPADATSSTPSPAGVSPTANVTGGIGPFTYLWSITSGGAGVTLSNTTSATASLVTNTGNIQTRIGTLQCAVTDTGNGGLVKNGTVNYTLEVL